MFDGLHGVDRASMERAYGSAEEVPAPLTALRSPDAEERREALDRSTARSTTRAVCTRPRRPVSPWPADDGATPGRATVIALLVGIRREFLDPGFGDDGTAIE